MSENLEQAERIYAHLMLLWTELAALARTVCKGWPFPNSLEQISLGQFYLEVERARRGSGRERRERMGKLKAALAYAERGWLVKHPDSSKDTRRIEQRCKSTAKPPWLFMGMILDHICALEAELGATP